MKGIEAKNYFFYCVENFLYTGFTKLIDLVTNVHNTKGYHFPGIYLVLIEPLGPAVFNDI